MDTVVQGHVGQYSKIPHLKKKEKEEVKEEEERQTFSDLQRKEIWEYVSPKMNIIS